VDNAFIREFDQIWDGFQLTLWLLFFSAILATILGTILGSFRVAPVRALRAIGTSYVNVFRNTPLVLILVLGAALIPTLGFNDLSFSIGVARFNTFFTMALLGLSAYTAAFVCEAIRSGVNSVPTGQAEAARSVGMGFVQSLRLVVLPQAFRAVIPPLTSIYIALAKNTSVVATVGVADAAFTMRKLGNQFTSDIYYIFFGVASGYVIIVLMISLAANIIERRLAVAR
jgi:glutamate transport system permease protein